jgi:hypothetical protein
MFVRYYVELPLAASQVEESLLASPPGWLAGIASEAQARGDELLTAVGVGPWGRGSGGGSRSSSATRSASLR